MGFEQFKRTKVNRGSRIPAIRVSKTQMWLTRQLTLQFLTDDVKAVTFHVDAVNRKLRLKKSDVGDATAFPVRYQVRNKEGEYTRAVINTTEFVREFKVVSGSYKMSRVSNGVYEGVYEVRT